MIEFAKQCLDKASDLDVRTAYSMLDHFYNETYGGNKWNTGKNQYKLKQFSGMVVTLMILKNLLTVV
jgi:hypothetical protein